MKRIFIYLNICLLSISLYAQQDWEDLGDQTIHHPINNFPFRPASLDWMETHDTKWWWENNPDRQCLEYTVFFNGGTNYDVTDGGYSSDFQIFWNKATRLMTNDVGGKKNYLALGWRYDKFNDSKLEVGFYAHRDHDEILPGITNRRIFEQLHSKSLNSSIPYATFNVKLAFTKELYYSNIDGYALLTIHDVETWDNNEEIETKLQYGWFGDAEQYFNTEDIYIDIKNVKLDRDSFWNNVTFTSAINSLKIAHTRIKTNFPYRTFSSNNIYLSAYCESTMTDQYTNEENVELSYKGSFLIIEGNGNQVNFYGNNIYYDYPCLYLNSFLLLTAATKSLPNKASLKYLRLNL